ncbi:MAG: response regulator [Candidatus Omnitrophica bacterium]|nr:response regulator [Candidatus Omnitrophota bacterium]
MRNETVRVFLIEDSDSDACLLQEELSQVASQKVAFVRAQRLDEAIAILSTNSFDVILLDLSLPDSQGLETVAHIQTRAPDLPIVVLTGISDERIGIEAVHRGVQDYLIKGQTNGLQIARAIRYAVERKHTEKALKQALAESARRTAELKAVFDAWQEPVVVFDAAGVPVRTNAAATAILGLIATGADGEAVGECLPSFTIQELDGRPVDRAKLPSRRALRGEVVRGERYVVKNSRGQRLTFEVNASPLYAGDHPAGAVAVWHDITEIIRGEERIIQLNQELEHKVRARTAQLRKLALELTQVEERERQRLARILHDHLQQLLVSAKYHLEILRRPCNSKITQDTARRVIELMDESIQTSRSLTMELSPPALYESVLATSLEWLGRWMHEKHHLEVIVEADPVASPEQEEVRVLLFQAVRELLFNVVKHAGVNTARVEVTKIAGNKLKIVVSDQGMGFDMNQPSPAGSSTRGFGLFSIRERLSLFGGSLQIESISGRGSRFTLVAPCQKLSKVAQPLLD